MDLTAEEWGDAAGRLGDERQVDRADLRLAAEISVEGGEGDPLAPPPVLQHTGAGADRLLPEIVALRRLDDLARQDLRAGGPVGAEAEGRRERLLRREP